MMNFIPFAATPPSTPPSSTANGSGGGSSGGGHECPTCKKTFSRSDILRKHLRTHVPCPCPVCGQLFQDKFTLAKHQIEVGRLLSELDYRIGQEDKQAN